MTIGIMLALLVAVEHFVIAYVEIFGNPVQQAKAFVMPLDFVERKEAKVALSNQGIYNAMLALTIVLAVFIFSGAILNQVILLLMIFICVVSLFGTFTVTKKIFFIQFLPAFFALILLFTQ